MKKPSRLKCAILILLLAATVLTCVACGESKTTETKTAAAVATKGINIATKNTPEQNILANLAKILIKEKMGVDADIVYFDDSTSAALLDKLESQKIQLFFDYSGSLAVNALNINTEEVNISTLLLDVQNTLRKQNGIVVSEQIGFNSTTAFYMAIDRKEALGGPSTLTDLAKISKKLNIGMTEDFYNRYDCYETLCTTYGMHFKKARVYDEENGFVALTQGDIDVFVGKSISPYFSLLNVTQLTDDQHFFLPQEACYLISDKALSDYPELEATMVNLEGLINASRMSLIVKRIYWEGNDIHDYLYTYLRANNII